ncbi:MAG: hypothetical protein ACOH1O_13150 [Flavobacterium sp.]
MRILQSLFNFYLQSSLHVAFAVYALLQMTQHMFDIQNDSASGYFAFFGTIVGYNFVKYDALARNIGLKFTFKIKAIIALSIISFAAAIFFFFKLQLKTQLISFLILLLTMLYTLPFFPNRRNARNWAGVKIYIVALCWVGVTLLLPLLNAEVHFGMDVLWKSIQRFILVFVLILVFEIIDLANDDPHLQTVPQQIGVKHTKLLGTVLLIPFYFLEFLKTNVDYEQLIINMVLVVILWLLLLNSSEKKSRYYTSFWVESVPILWWIMVLGAHHFVN